MRLWLLCCLFPLGLSGQVADNFNTIDLSTDTVWKGMLNSFQISNGMLQSNSNVSNSMFYISTGIEISSTTHWSLFQKLNFNPSSANYVDFVLCSDSANLLTMKNGLLIRSGGSTDEISMYRLNNGIETKLTDGNDAVLNHSSNTFKLKVDYLHDTFYLYHLTESDSVIQSSSAISVLSNVWRYAGIRIKQSTSSFFNKHYFDDLYIGPVIRDTQAPVVDSCWFESPSKLHFLFNENLDTGRLNSVNLKVNAIQCLPDKLYRVGLRHLIADVSCILPNQFNSICIDSVLDIAGNFSNIDCNTVFTLNTVKAVPFDILINELMPDPDPPVDAYTKEYIELYNRTDKYIDVTNLLICDPGACRELGQTVLFPDSFIVLYNIPSLNNGGDHIRLIDKDSNLIHELNYNLNSYQNQIKSNGGYSLELIDPYHLCRGKSNWTASSDLHGGTPGKVNSVRNSWPDDKEAPYCTRIETQAPDKIKLFFSEAFDSVFQSYLTISMNHVLMNASIIQQSAGEAFIELKLPVQPASSSKLKLVLPGFKDCDGNVLDSQVLLVNWMSIPERHDIIINEVLFNPKSGGADFIELLNRSDKFIDLNTCFIVDHEQNQIKKIIRISPNYQPFKPGNFLLLSNDTGLVCRDYHCGDSQMIKIQMDEMPSMPDEGVSFFIVNLNFDTLDSLVCSDDWHFSLISDKNGVSLERINPDNFLMQKENWHSASFVAGYATPGYQNSQFLKAPMNTSYFNPQSLCLSPDNDAHDDFILLSYNLPAPDYLCTLRIFNSKGELVAEPYNNRSIGTEGQLIWDGTDLNGEKCLEGFYLMTVMCNSPSNKQIINYFTFYLTYNAKSK